MLKKNIKENGRSFKFSKVLCFNQQLVKDFVYKNKIPKLGKSLNREQRVYLKIEKQLINLSNKDLEDFGNTNEDYPTKILYSAMERVAGSSLSLILDDRKFENKLDERIKNYSRVYYKITSRYKLPTIRIIPFLTRLIFM